MKTTLSMESIEIFDAVSQFSANSSKINQICRLRGVYIHAQDLKDALACLDHRLLIHASGLDELNHLEALALYVLKNQLTPA